MLPAVKYAVIPVSGICGGGDGGWDNRSDACYSYEKAASMMLGTVGK